MRNSPRVSWSVLQEAAILPVFIEELNMACCVVFAWLQQGTNIIVQLSYGDILHDGRIVGRWQTLRFIHRHKLQEVSVGPHVLHGAFEVTQDLRWRLSLPPPGILRRNPSKEEHLCIQRISVVDCEVLQIAVHLDGNLRTCPTDIQVMLLCVIELSFYPNHLDCIAQLHSSPDEGLEDAGEDVGFAR